MVPVALALPMVLSFFVWLAVAAMTFWVWKGTKAKATLLTMIGAALLALVGFLAGFELLAGDLAWVLFAGGALVAVGYYLTVKPVVDAHVRELKALRVKAKASSTHADSPSTPAA